MHLGKIFILALLATCHLYTANAMVEDQLLNEIKTIKVQDRPDITYNGRVGFGNRCDEDQTYQKLCSAFGPPKGYFLCSDEDATLYEEQGQSRLYNLLFTRWESQDHIENQKKAMIVMWTINKGLTSLKDSYSLTDEDSCPLPDKDDTIKAIYTNMKKESQRLSLESLMTQLQQENVLYVSIYLDFHSMLDMLNNNQNLKETIRQLWWHNERENSGFRVSTLIDGHSYSGHPIENPLDLWK